MPLEAPVTIPTFSDSQLIGFLLFLIRFTIYPNAMAVYRETPLEILISTSWVMSVLSGAASMSYNRFVIPCGDPDLTVVMLSLP